MKRGYLLMRDAVILLTVKFRKAVERLLVVCNTHTQSSFTTTTLLIQANHNILIDVDDRFYNFNRSAIMRTLPNMQAVKGAISFLWLLLFLSPHLLIPHHHVDAVSGGSSEFQLMSRIKERHPDFVPRTIVDVGANRGDWTVGVRSVFPTANFFMLEASPDKDAVLKDVISSHFTNEDTNSGRAGYSIAVMSASANETIPFFQGGDTGNSMFRENTHYYENDTPVMRISSTLDLEVEASFVDIETVDILKIDVQGAELMVLRGGPKVLEAATFVQLESGSIEYNAGGCCFYEIDEILRSHGFYLYDIGELAYNPTFFKTSGVGQFDILYVKPSSSNLPQGLQQSKFCGANKNTISSKEEPTSNHQDIPLVEAHAMSEESMDSFFRRIGPAAAWVTVGFVAAFILQMFLPKRPFLQRTNRAHISSHLSPKESSGTRYQRYTFVLSIRHGHYWHSSP
jgi:FkbM family methyltransferase